MTMNDALTYIRDQFKIAQPHATTIAVTFNDDETISVVVAYNDHADDDNEYEMHVMSDDDAYVFMNVDEMNDVVTFPIPCDDE